MIRILFCDDDPTFVSSQAVSKWENGHSLPDILTIARIAGVLGVSCDDLILEADGSLL